VTPKVSDSSGQVRTILTTAALASRPVNSDGGCMSDDSWDPARLIPTSESDDADEQARRATSALLAVIGAVPDFGRMVIQPLGAPAGVIETFIRVSFRLGDRTCFPAGLIRVQHGQRHWAALVEVRTGSTGVDVIQLEMILDVAYEQGFDAVLTISNEVSQSVGRHPLGVHQRRLRAVGLHHCPWSQLLATAVVQREQCGIADPDQAWLLGELVRYLEHPQSGTSGFEDLGSAQIVRRVEIADAESAAACVPEQREPVIEIDVRDPQATVLHTVLIAESAVRVPPSLPSRREVRLVRQLGANTGDRSTARNDAGWYQDPGDAHQLRWWDGVGWSERTYPAQPALA
jgi:hypothetical protein